MIWRWGRPVALQVGLGNLIGVGHDRFTVRLGSQYSATPALVSSVLAVWQIKSKEPWSDILDANQREGLANPALWLLSKWARSVN
jgi:hypothetical protein